MSVNIPRTFSFSDGFDYTAGMLESELSNIVNILNNTNAGLLTWDNVNTKLLKLKDAAATPKAITLTSPAALTNNYTLTYPVDQGGSGQVLSNNGAGVLSWASVPTAPVTIANGGTNSIASLSNNRVMISSGGAIVEQGGLTGARVLVTDVNGLPVVASVTTTTLAFLDATSSIQTQINAKAPTASPTLTGTVTVPNGVNSTDAAAYGQLQARQTTIQTTKSTVFTTSSSTYQSITGMSVAITPTSSSSRVRIRAMFSAYMGSASNFMHITMKRGTTDLAPNAAGFFVLGSSVTNDIASSGVIDYIDSPAATTATTYQLFLKNSNNTTTVGICNNGELATIIAEEIQ